MKLQLNIYRGLTILLLILLIVIFNIMDNDYNELLEVNNQLSDTIKANEVTYNDSISQYKEQVEELNLEIFKKDMLIAKLEEEKKLDLSKRFPYTHEEIVLLAKCVQAEAGYPTRKLKESQKYTTQVILNRVKSKDFPNTIRGVIYEKHNGIPQFSVTTNGAIDKCDLQYRTLLNVYDVLIHGTDLPSYVKYFYSASVKENWVCNLNTYKKTGGSIFAYKDKE